MAGLLEHLSELKISNRKYDILKQATYKSNYLLNKLRRITWLGDAIKKYFGNRPLFGVKYGVEYGVEYGAIIQLQYGAIFRLEINFLDKTTKTDDSVVYHETYKYLLLVTKCKKRKNKQQKKFGRIILIEELK